jgi:hypothetical protein
MIEKPRNTLNAKRSHFRRTHLSFLLAIAAFAFSLVPAQAVVINLDATVIGNKTILGAGHYVEVNLQAGTYLVTPISLPTPGADYTAWSAWGSNSGCDLSSGICSGAGWLNTYYVADNGTGDVPEILLGDGVLYATEALAFAHAQSYQFTLPTDQFISFYLTDNPLANLADNRGGISLDISAVPLPGALPLFAGGLGVMGLVGWRRRKRIAKTAT